MPNTFFIGDTHFGHANILTFKDNDGAPLRSFDSVEEMDEHMIERWNSVVNRNDVIYHMGDVAMNRKYLALLGRCRGRKKLVRGNHDTAPLRFYTRHFDQIHGVKVFAIPRELGGGSFIATHIPIHSGSMGRFKVNVHGHLHCNLVQKERLRAGEWWGHTDPDERYINVCVEQINYTPISIDEIYQRIEKL